MPDLKVRVGGAWQSVTTTGPAGPPGAGGGAHHLTHEVGGSDQITGAMAFSTLNLSGNATVGGDVLFTPGGTRSVLINTTAGAHTEILQLSSGGFGNGGTIYMYGNNHPGSGGSMFVQAGNVATTANHGKVSLVTGSGLIPLHCWPSGGVCVGPAADPGLNNLGVYGEIIMSGAGNIHSNTADGADTHMLSIGGGGAAYDLRGAAIQLYGNESGGTGTLGVYAGNTASAEIQFYTGGVKRGAMHPSGGFSWGSSVDPGVGNFRVGGTAIAIIPTIPTSAAFTIVTNTGGSTYFGRENSANNIFGAGAYTGVIYDNGAAGLALMCNHATAPIKLCTMSTERGRIHPTGGFSWGGTVDPGAGCFVVGTFAGGQGYSHIQPSTISMGMASSPQNAMVIYATGGATAGQILVTGSTTQFITTSDVRLKTDRGRHTDTSVLERTIVHAFDWKSDGTPGRGVFAQEAVSIAPFAVSVGSDEVDDLGRVTQWGVDYSKYVPDLIVGWQAHDAKVAALEAKIAKLEAMIEKLLT